MSDGILKKRFRVKRGGSFFYSFIVSNLTSIVGFSVLESEVYKVHTDSTAAWTFSGTITDTATKTIQITWLPAATASVADVPATYHSTVYIQSGTETFPVLDVTFDLEPERNSAV